MDKLEIHANTKISELINWNKESIYAIAKLSKPLERLKNPVLRKLMASRVTVKEAAQMGGCTISDFEQALKPLGFVWIQEGAEAKQDVETPEWLKVLPKESIRVFDVRDILARGERPLREILKLFKSILPNQALCIINTFIPIPLIRLLEKDKILSFSEVVSQKEYHTYFYKQAMSTPQEPIGKPKTIWTIGHSTRSWEEFVDLLKINSINLLIDVRSLPGSNKFPQFNKEHFENELSALGIEYEHYLILGGRRKVRKDSVNTAWRNDSFRGYADYMETADFREGLTALEKQAAKKNVCIMCAEAVWWRCHRSMIADRMKLAGWTVLHILSEKKIEEHPYTSAATIKNGELLYH